MGKEFIEELSKPFVSVIVPVYNDAGRIGKCIEALLNQTYPNGKYEIIIIDNGSTDNTCSLIKRYPVKLLIEDERQSSYAARNKGIRNAKGEVIAFTDSDCVPAPDWIEKGVKNLLQTHNCGLVGGRINIFFRNSGKPNAVELYDSVTNFKQKEDIEKRRFGSTANVFTFKKVIDRVGLFNDTLKSGGDNEWGRRVFSFGYNQVYADDVCVAHPARDSLKQLYQRITRLIGGNYDQIKQRTKSWEIYSLKYFLRSIKNMASFSVRTFWGMTPMGSVLGIKQKIKIIFIYFCVEIFRNHERVRLIFGGKPKR